MLIDSHAHLTCKELLPQIEDLITHAREAKITHIVNICTDLASLEAGLKYAERFPEIYNTAATTPHDVEKEGKQFFPYVEKAAKEKKLVAIGETGLDYYYEHSPKKTQQHYLTLYLKLAQKYHLPVIFHCRDAFSDLFAITAEQEEEIPSVLHCFTGNLQEAKGVLDRGWYLSFSGIITFKKSEELRNIVKYVPLDRIFIETDAPYLAPQSKRGKQNEPAFIQETAALIAKIKAIPESDVIQMTAQNALQFFSLK